MSHPCLADDLREALGGRWDGPPVYVVVPSTLTLETERAVFAATGLKGSFRLQVVDWSGLARGVLKGAGRRPGAPLSQDAWRLLVTARLRRDGPGGLLPGIERRTADTLWDAILAQPRAAGEGLEDVFPAAEAKLLIRLFAELEPTLERLAHPARLALEASAVVGEVGPTVFVLEDPEPNPFRDILGPAVLALPQTRCFPRRDLFGVPAKGVPFSTGEGLAISQAAHPLAEAWLAVARARDLVESGSDPSRITLTSPRIRTYVPHLKRAFAEAAVAADILVPAGLHGGEVRLLRALLHLGRHGGSERRRTIVDIAASGLLPKVSDAVLPRRRRVADLERLIDDGHGVLADLLAFGRGFPEDRPLAEHLGHLSRFLDAQELPAQVARRGDAEAWNAVMDALRMASDVLGDLPLASQVARDLLTSALLSARPAHPIPNHAAVRVVDLEEALAAPSPHLLVLGLADRSLAGPSRRGLTPVAGAPADHPLMRLWRDRQAWDETLADRLRKVRTETLHVSYPIDDGTGGRAEPALLVAEAAERFPDCLASPPGDPLRDALSRADLAAVLARTIAERRRLGQTAAAEEALARRLADLDGAGEALSSLAAPAPEARLAPDVARELFAHFSASSLEARAACPTKHLASALGLEDGPDDPYDLRAWGERAHGVLEKVMREVMAGQIPATGGALAARAREMALEAVEGARDLLPGERRRALAEIFALSLERAAREIGEDLEHGAFVPVETEKRFGGDSGTEVTLPHADQAFSLSGRIDRADRRQDGGLRLVDYKTGKAKIDYARLYHGLDVQLALYARAAEAMGMGSTVRLVLWPVPSSRVHVALPGARPSRHPERPDEIDLEKEPTAALLLSRTRELAGRLAVQARKGIVAPQPVKLGRHLACEDCSLLPVCRAEAPKARRLVPMGKRDVLAALREGMS